MNSSIVSSYIGEYAALPLGDDRAGFAEASVGHNRGARGAIAGVLLGASFWGAILVVAGFIKL